MNTTPSIHDNLFRAAMSWQRKMSLALLISIVSAASGALAADRYWDPNEGGGGVGGAGTWQNGGATTLWNTASDGSGSAVSWNNANGDLAFFGGTAGAVTVSGTVAVGGTIANPGLSFTTGGYQLTGGTILFTPTGNSSSFRTVDFLSGGSDVTVDSSIQFDGSSRVDGSNTRFVITNSTAAGLTFGGGIQLTSSTTGARNITLSQIGGAGSITLNGAITNVSSNASTLLVGDASSSSTGSYYINGNNSGLAGGSVTADLRNGRAYIGNANALGAGLVRLGTSNTAGDTVQLLTNAAITISNQIRLDGDLGATRVMGGATAQTSTYSGEISFFNRNYALQLTAANGGRVDFSGLIDDGSGTGSIEKIGAGTVLVTGATGNTYDGGTTVTLGTLLVNNSSGSGLGTGAVTVASGASLGGTGSISGAVTVNGSITPGDGGIESFAVQNDVTWNGAASASSATDWKFELGAANAADLLAITGDFDRGTGSTFRFDFLGSSDLGTFVLIDWTGGTTFDVTDFSYTNLSPGNTALFAFNGSQLEVTVSAVPEPSAASVVIVGLFGLLLSLRRSSRHRESAA